jgi:pyruvate dehydrogenase E2 component (dihydrolipoamide acetyltransferase)
VPLYVLVGAVCQQPAAVDGEVVAQPQLTMTATIDHRFVDGHRASALARIVRAVFAEPDTYDDALPALAPAAPR